MGSAVTATRRDGVLEVVLPIEAAMARTSASILPVWWLVAIGAALTFAIFFILARSLIVMRCEAEATWGVTITLSM